jgi:hypothetical protein
MTSNLSMSDICLNGNETQNNIKLLTTSQTQSANNTSLINLPLITSGIIQFSLIY